MEDLNTNINIVEKHKTSSRDFFLHFGAFIALYVSIISILALWFKIIDEFFADPLKYSDPYSGGVSIAIASLLIVFPVFIVTSWVIHKDEEKDPQRREFGIKKGVIYLTLFIAGIIITTDLVVLLNTFLSGREITASFVSKVFVVFVIIGAIFAYYIKKIRSSGGISNKLAKIFTISTALFVVISIIVGFIVMGSPQKQRMKRMDAQRIFALQNIQQQVVNYWRRNSRLPNSINDAMGNYSYIPLVDPSTKKPYVYKTTGYNSYKLCAVFDLKNSGIQSGYGYSINSGLWKHDAGEVCFDRVIDSGKYKLRVSPQPAF